MKHLLLTLAFLLGFNLTMQAQCSDFDAIVADGERYLENSDYEKAIASYTRAMEACKKKADLVVPRLNEAISKMKMAQLLASEMLERTIQAEKLIAAGRKNAALGLLQASYHTFLEKGGKEPPTPFIAALSALYYRRSFPLEVMRFNLHEQGVRSVAFSPDGQYVLTGSNDSTAILWNLQGLPLQTFIGHKHEVRSVAFSPDGKYILTGSADSTAMLWDLKGQALQVFKEHNARVNAVAFSPNGKLILTGSELGENRLGDGARNTAILWNLDGTVMQTFEGEYWGVNDVAFAPDGKHIVTASGDGHDISVNSVGIWSLDGKHIRDVGGHRDAVLSVDVSPDGQYIISGGVDGSIYLSTFDGRFTEVFSKGILHDYAPVMSVAFSPDGYSILTGGPRDAIVWNINGSKDQIISDLGTQISSIAFSPDGKQILLGSFGFAFQQNLDDFSRRNAGVATLWEFASNSPLEIKAVTEYGNLNAVTCSPDGTMVATGEGSYKTKGIVCLWDMQGNNLQSFDGHALGVKSIQFSPDGKYILTGSFDSTAMLWNMEGKVLHTFSAHKGVVCAVAFSPDGQHILTGSDDGTAILWDLKGQVLQRFAGANNVTSVAFSPDGKYVLTGNGYDFTATLWDWKANPLQIFRSPREIEVTSVAFSPDGQYVLAGAGDLLDAKDLAILWDLQGNVVTVFNKHLERVNSVAFSPDGKYLMTGSGDYLNKDDHAIIWDHQGKIAQITYNQSSILSVAFSPDGQKFVIGTARGEAYIYLTYSGIWSQLQKKQHFSLGAFDRFSVDLALETDGLLKSDVYWHLWEYGMFFEDNKDWETAIKFYERYASLTQAQGAFNKVTALKKMQSGR